MNATTAYDLRAESGTPEIVVVKEYDAPRERVFAVYTDPDLIPRWWGPRNLTTTVVRMEPRSGGSWQFVQRDTDGNEFGFHGVYHEVAPHERIVQTFEFEGVPGHVALETAIFEDLGGRTRVTTQSVFQSIADRDGMIAAGMESGLADSLARIEELLRDGDG